MSSPNQAYPEAIRLLHRYRQKQKSHTLLAVVFGEWTLCLFLGGILCVSEIVFRFPPAVRTILVSVFLLLVSALLLRAGVAVASLFRKHVPTDVDLALEIGGRDPDIRDRFADALQVVREDGTVLGTSDEMAAASLERALEQVRRIDPVHRFPGSRRGRNLVFFAMSVVAAAGMAFLPPFGDASYRLIHPGREFPVPAAFRLEVFPGNATVLLGEDVEIAVRGTGEVPEEMTLIVGESDGGVREHVLRPPFEHVISNVKRDLRYSVRARRVKTETYTIRVLERPMVRSMRVSVREPAYARLGARVLEPNTGGIEALKGASVRVDVTASKPLARSSLTFEAKGAFPMRIDGVSASGEFSVEEEDRYRVDLTDTAGITNDGPISFPVRIVPDASPVARIVVPGEDVDLDERMTLPLRIEAEDDFGLSRAGLLYTVLPGGDAIPGDTVYHPLPLSRDEPPAMLLEHDWDLEPLGLLPEDVVAYCCEVRDNDGVSGPKRARSRWYRARFPSMYEIFEEAEAEQGHQMESLEELAGESRELSDVLENISDEMKGGEEWGWEDRKALESAREKQERMLEKVDSLRTRLEELTDRLDRNDLLGLETLEKYQELQQLYEEIASPELLDAMKKLQEEMDRLSEESLRQATERFRLSQENFLRSIDRTISLLKRIQVEQKLDEILGRIDDLRERQSEINEGLAGEESMDRLAGKEREASLDAEELGTALEGLYRKMEPLPGMPLEDLGAAMEEMERRGPRPPMDRAVRSMEEGMRGDAREHGAEAEEALGMLRDRVETIRNRLLRNEKERVAGALKRASHRLLQLSRGEEALMQGAEGGSMPGSEAARRQQSLMSGLSSVVDSLMRISEQSFFITPEMGRFLGQARVRMAEALRQLQEGGRGASGHQGEAMGALNRSVMAIQDALGRLQGAGSGLGMEEFLLQLEQMGMEQMRINRQAMDLLQGGSLSLEQQAAISRLAAEQEVLKRTLEEALKRFGPSSDIPGRLDNLVEEMEEIVQDLLQRGARRETLQRQERILSRLLDAQRSVRRRDTSRRRRGETGVDVNRAGPEAGMEEIAGWRERIRRDILRMGKEGYTQEYQDVIRRYFEALSSEKR